MGDVKASKFPSEITWPLDAVGILHFLNILKIFHIFKFFIFPYFVKQTVGEIQGVHPDLPMIQ